MFFGSKIAFTFAKLKLRALISLTHFRNSRNFENSDYIDFCLNFIKKKILKCCFKILNATFFSEKKYNIFVGL